MTALTAPVDPECDHQTHPPRQVTGYTVPPASYFRFLYKKDLKLILMYCLHTGAFVLLLAIDECKRGRDYSHDQEKTIHVERTFVILTEDAPVRGSRLLPHSRIIRLS